MKKTLALLLCVGFTTAALAQGSIVRLTRFENQPITGVAASSGFEVELIKSEQTSVQIEISPELEDGLLLNISSDGVVSVGLQPKTRSSKTSVLKAKIYVNNLKSLKASSGAQINSQGEFSGEALVVEVSSGSKIEELNYTASDHIFAECSSSGKLNGTFNARILRCDLSSSASANLHSISTSAVLSASSAAVLEIAGSAEEATINTSSSAGVRGDLYTITKATLNATSTSKITVGQVSELSASASSAAAIRYRGNPTVNALKNSSAGTVKKID